MRIKGKLISRWVTEGGAYAEIEWVNPCDEVAADYFGAPCARCKGNGGDPYDGPCTDCLGTGKLPNSIP